MRTDETVEITMTTETTNFEIILTVVSRHPVSASAVAAAVSGLSNTISATIP